MEDSAPFVSVVVPTYNRAELLRDCLESLLVQDYPHDRFEIIVVNDGSTDNTKTVVSGLTGLKGYPISPYYLYQDHGGPNAARNCGISLARGELICFVDDDTVTPQPWLRAMVSGYQRWSEAGCYGGPIRLRLEGPAPRFCGREELTEGELDLGVEERPVGLVYSGNMAVTRKAFDTAGLFLNALRGDGEEDEWEQRHLNAGGQVFYVPEAWLWHRRTAKELRLWRFARRRFRRGRTELPYLRLSGESPTVCAELSAVPRVLAHALLHRCAWGILASAQHLGRIWSILRD